MHSAARQAARLKAEEAKKPPIASKIGSLSPQELAERARMAEVAIAILELDTTSG